MGTVAHSKKLNTRQSNIYKKSNIKYPIKWSLKPPESISAFQAFFTERSSILQLFELLCHSNCGGLKFENRLLLLHRHLSRLKWNSGGKTGEISESRVWSFYRVRVWHKVCIICLILLTHEKKEHKQQQMWGKGVRNEVLDPTSHYR